MPVGAVLLFIARKTKGLEVKIIEILFTAKRRNSVKF